MQARSWENTTKIGFWTTLLHGRHLVNECGSLEPLLQYRIQIVGKLPSVSFCKCSTARALFPNSKSSRAILWRELPCLLQIDIKTPHWALHISPMSSSMKWEMWTSQIWWRQKTQRMKLFRAFVRTLMAPEKAWASIVTTDGKYLVNHIIIIQQVLDTLIRSLGALSLNNTKKSTVIVTNIWRCHTDRNSVDSMLCSNIPSVLLAYSQSEDKALIVMTSFLIWPPKLSIFLYLSLWTAILKIAT